MTIVVAVGGVVDCVVASTHDRPHLTMDAVMNVCRPQSLKKQEKYVSHKLGRDNEEGYHMWQRLQYPIQWMECQSCEEDKLVAVFFLFKSLTIEESMVIQ